MTCSAETSCRSRRNPQIAAVMHREESHSDQEQHRKRLRNAPSRCTHRAVFGELVLGTVHLVVPYKFRRPEQSQTAFAFPLQLLFSLYISNSVKSSSLQLFLPPDICGSVCNFDVTTPSRNPCSREPWRKPSVKAATSCAKGWSLGSQHRGRGGV